MSILTINQTAVIMDVNVYQCNKDDATLFQIIDEVQFVEYPHCNGTAWSNFNLLPMDTVVVKAQFHVKQGTEEEPNVLRSIFVGAMMARQNGIEEFALESFTINTSEFLPNCDNIQEIEFSQDRDFIIPAGDCRNKIRLFRMPTLDISVPPVLGSGGVTEYYAAYELIYPFKVRWEEWRSLSGAGRCFPTPTQNWMVYANTTGWTPKISIKAEVEVQRNLLGLGVVVVDTKRYTTQFEHITWGVIQDPCDIPYAVEFNTLDSTGAISYEEIIANDADTVIQATITGDFSGYTADQLYGLLSLDAWSVGGVAYVQEIGTRLAVDADGVWKGNAVGTSLVATLTKVSANTMRLSAYIDYLYLPTDTKQFILSAKIREFHQSTSSSGATCLNEIEIISMTCGELEIIQVVNDNTIIVSGEVVTDEMRGVFAEAIVLTFVTATSWIVSGGTINGNPILSGTMAGNIVSAPVHPYTNSIVGNTIQGDITGTLNTSIIDIDGIGDMQIGC